MFSLKIRSVTFLMSKFINGCLNVMCGSLIIEKFGSSSNRKEFENRKYPKLASKMSMLDLRLSANWEARFLRKEAVGKSFNTSATGMTAKRCIKKTVSKNIVPIIYFLFCIYIYSRESKLFFSFYTVRSC